MPIAVALVDVALLILVAVAAPMLLTRGRDVATAAVYGASAILSAAQAGLGVAVLATGGDSQLTLPLGLPWLGASFRLDALAAVFLAIVGFGGMAASGYAFGYGRHEEAPGRVLPFYPAFLAGMCTVVLAADAFSFLVAWEFMSLASWTLVMAHHRDEANRQAGYIYLMMASLGTMALLLAFGLLAGPDGGYGFETIRGLARAEWITPLVLVLMMVGAGSKAGLVPLHVWLPLAHPAAPSHVSALMSGVMTKVAVYGFIRVVFDLAGPPAWWWGLAVLVVGSVTAVLGVLQALFQRDLKRLLAYSTVENVGIIFIGLGLALAFEANAMPGPAALAATAAVLHAGNHMLFKSLLFFGAGAVLTATGVRDLERLGGLVHRMPVVAYTFLAGCLAISALPPLNGFVSEWLVFQAMLLSPDLPQWGLKVLVPASAAMLALAAALAGATFVRAFGVAFLGRPRSPAAEAATEGDRPARITMLTLAGACLVIGVVPGFFIDLLAPAARIMVAARMPSQDLLPLLSIVPVSESRSSYSGLLVFFFIVVSARLAVRIIHDFASRDLRRGPAWDCGFPDANPATQYTADSFAQPFRRVFGPLVLRAKFVSFMPKPGDLAAARLVVSMRDVVWEVCYAPVSGFVHRTAERLNVLQFLTIRSYLSLVFAALVALLLVVAAWT
jgi:formate hydrogenlyase subunit 3/multisubunit Na+/H+ antiporter MnhD subunit